MLAAPKGPPSIAGNTYVVVDDADVDVSQDNNPQLVRRRTVTSKGGHGKDYLLALDIVKVTSLPLPSPLINHPPSTAACCQNRQATCFCLM